MPGDSIEQVVDSYGEYIYALQGTAPLKRFVERLEASPEVAKAEAVIFAWARALGLRPEIAESPSSGGMDFLCRPKTGSPFELEVTAIGTEAVVNKSKLPNDLEHIGGAYSLITRTLRGRVKSKRKQLAKSSRGMARAIALASMHPMADLILNRMAAVSLFVSDPFISSPIYADGIGPGGEATDLKSSAFLQPSANNPEIIELINREVSAILLVPILTQQVRPVGILHPAPIYPFDIFSLPLIPLLQLDSWPIKDGEIVTRWTWESDPPYPFHQRIRLRFTNV